MKTGKVAIPVIHLLSSSIFPLFLLTLFCLSVSSSSSVSNKHKNLLVYDLRKSSGVSLFFILSFIIITLSLGRRTSNSCEGDHYDRFFPSFPLVYEVETNNIINKEIEVYYYYYDSSDDDGDDEYHHHGYDGYDEDNDMEIEDVDDSSEEENDDKELERRIEEFVAKVYRKRREELAVDSVLCLTAA